MVEFKIGNFLFLENKHTSGDRRIIEIRDSNESNVTYVVAASSSYYGCNLINLKHETKAALELDYKISEFSLEKYKTNYWSKTSKKLRTYVNQAVKDFIAQNKYFIDENGQIFTPQWSSSDYCHKTYIKNIANFFYYPISNIIKFCKPITKEEIKQKILLEEKYENYKKEILVELGIEWVSKYKLGTTTVVAGNILEIVNSGVVDIVKFNRYNVVDDIADVEYIMSTRIPSDIKETHYVMSGFIFTRELGPELLVKQDWKFYGHPKYEKQKKLLEYLEVGNIYLGNGVYMKTLEANLNKNYFKVKTLKTGQIDNRTIDDFTLDVTRTLITETYARLNWEILPEYVKKEFPQIQKEKEIQVETKKESPVTIATTEVCKNLESAPIVVAELIDGTLPETNMFDNALLFLGSLLILKSNKAKKLLKQPTQPIKEIEVKC